MKPAKFADALRIIGDATEDEMILAFLRAEVRSPRFRRQARRALDGDLSLVNQPRDDPTENLNRKLALAGYRGFGVGTFLFSRFPSDVDWKRAMLTRSDLGALRYANWETWRALSGGSRILADGAANVGRFPVPEDADTHIAAVERDFSSGRRYAEIILAAERPDAVHYVVEGHTRATAYYRALPVDSDDEIEVIVGYASGLATWAGVG